jgi:diguanylate cyclase (GGDEF)-like protein
MIAQYEIFFLIALLASIVMFSLAIYLSRFRNIQSVSTFMILLTLIGIWALSIDLGYLSDTVSESYFWSTIRMTAVFAVPVFWLMFSRQYCQYENKHEGELLFALLIIPAMSFVMMITNDSHHLFLKEIIYVQRGKFLIDETWVTGKWFYLHAVYSYSLILIADTILVKEAIKRAHTYRKQAVFLIIGALFPLIVNILFTFHVIPFLKIDYDPLGFVLTGICFAFGIFQFKLFDINPLAKKILMQNIDDPILVINEKNKIVEINPAAVQQLKIEKNSAIGQELSLYLSRFEYPFGETSRHEYYPDKASGKCYEAQVSPIYDRKLLLGHVIIMRDISERKALLEQLSLLAISDPLTNLYNCRHFLSLAEKEIDRSQRYGHPFSVCFLDLDGFKKVNDHYGHEKGDQVLVEIANLLRVSFRTTDLISRYGGDEFVVMMLETIPEDAELIARRIQEGLISFGNSLGVEETPLTVSIGMMHFDPLLNLNIRQLIHRADQLMYQAKSMGENCMCVE